MRKVVNIINKVISILTLEIFLLTTMPYHALAENNNNPIVIV